MSKTITIQMKHEYQSKGKMWTVEEALEWANSHLTDDEGEPKFSPGDLLIKGVTREIALYKDNKRYKKGVLAERRYAPRVDNVENKPRKLAGLVEEIHATAPRKPAPERKPRKAAKRKARPQDRGNAEVAATL